MFLFPPPPASVLESSDAHCFTVVRLCPSVCLHKLNLKTLHVPLSLTLYLVTTLIFGVKVHLIYTHQVVPRSRSSIKVKIKYQGHVQKKKKKKPSRGHSCFTHICRQ